MALQAERQLEIVTQQIVRAKIFYDIWWFYHGSDTRPLIIDTLNEFSEFFRFDAHAHFVSMIVHCAVIWDPGLGKISLPSVARLTLDPKRNECDKELSRKIDIQRKAAKGLVQIRHEAIAHRSAISDYDEAIKRQGVVINTIPAMLVEWLETANELRAIRNPKMEEVDFHDLPLNHLQRLTHKLGGPNLHPRTSLDQILDG